ncbi:MAG: sigma-54 dependent transcriptional regulator [Gammaproteobacteria bacterium]|nr:sigma-54 dependent transcriptional regulator [Gammaproteobacteria bacterium]MCY4282347.1 sigma-54 dependent transcriptional regulator [Gammaproteobacteria bacterium]MCY4337971.1 sigma-54 dependent transcriptional regulator [Gammaproteobacteria bacterium]
MNGEKILVVDDEAEIRRLIREILVDEGFEVATAENAAAARTLLEQFRPRLVLLDIWMPDMDGITLLKEWRDSGKLSSPVIMMSGHGNIGTAVEATRLGAYDYLEKPLSLAKLMLTIRNALQASRLQKENLRLRLDSNASYRIIGKSRLMSNLREQLHKVADLDTPVLIVGEPGTDKEALARHLHTAGARRDKSFVNVSVSAREPEAVINELYGEQVQDEAITGHLDEAEGGTLFIKDIADMDQVAQARLCDMLKDRSYKRVNGSTPITLSARVIAATRHNLANRVQEGAFLDELYFQLNVVPITVPALREHYEDVPAVLEYFVNFLVEQEGLPYRSFTTAAQNRLRRYPWPGNIRELKNLVQRMLILGGPTAIDLEEVETTLGDMPVKKAADSVKNLDLPLRQARENFERDYLEYQLKLANGSVSKMARNVHMERTHLYRKLKSLGIDIKS